MNYNWDGHPTPPAVNLDGWIDNQTPYDPTVDGPADVTALRCTLCGVPTTWTSPKGIRCHPSCATMYLRERARRTTTSHPA